MITQEALLSISRNDLRGAAERLDAEDVRQLVEWLSLKDDTLRYQALLLLQERSVFSGDVYPHWDTLRAKLGSGNSYQRSIGLMLMAENARWDTEGRMEAAMDDYLPALRDEKPITVRQCVRSLGKIAASKPALGGKIASALLSLDLTAVKETMRKSILLDILNALLVIRKETRTDEIEGFIASALSGDILDKKSKKQIGALL